MNVGFMRECSLSVMYMRIDTYMNVRFMRECYLSVMYMRMSERTCV